MALTSQQKEVHVNQLEGERGAREQTRKKILLHSLTEVYLFPFQSLQIADDVVSAITVFDFSGNVRYRVPIKISLLDYDHHMFT
jgi:hypothetical protein